MEKEKPGAWREGRDFRPNSGRVIGALIWLAALLVAFALWFPVACLIVSGIPGRAMRVAVFALMFWAAYSAIILAQGAGPGFLL